MVELGKAIRQGQQVFTEAEVIDLLDVVSDNMCENMDELLWCVFCQRRHQGRRVELGKIVQDYVQETEADVAYMRERRGRERRGEMERKW